jgi:hypothetical protein
VAAPKHIFRPAILLLFLILALALTVRLVGGAAAVKANAVDLAELNDVKYGLLDADNWVSQISVILDRRIDQFELTEQNKPEIKRQIERVLDRLIVEIDQYQRRQNRGDGSWVDRVRGSIRQGVQDLFLDLDDVRRRVPIYAEQILNELAKPDAKGDLKRQVKGAVEDLAGSTFAKTDRAPLQAILARYRCADVAECQAPLRARIEQGQRSVDRLATGVMSCVAGMFVIGLFRGRELHPSVMLMLTLATLVLLAGGLLTPMIEIEAKIAALRLQLLGEPVAFENQVLYFQSKSVLDVVRVLVETGKLDMVLVGGLIGLFSILFPTIKVAASFLYFYDYRGLRTSPLVRFFALKSGKWSMADVMVIAMFMAFVGFRGLVSSQLANLQGSGRNLEVLTTNGTLLQVGFYLFLGFCIASLVISAVLDVRLGERHVT